MDPEGSRVTKDFVSHFQAHIALRFALFRNEISSSTTVRIYVLFTLVSFTLVLVSLASYFTSTTTKTSSQRTLACMLHVLTPVYSLWPQTYVRFCKQHYLRIPLRILIEDVIAGNVELRAPEEDLQRLLIGSGCLDVEDCVLLLSVGLLLRVSVLWWWMKTALPMKRHTLRELNLQVTEEINASHYSDPCNLSVESVSHRSSPQAFVPRSDAFHTQNRYPTGVTNTLSRSHSVLPALLPTLPLDILDRLAIVTTLDSISLTCLETNLLAAPPGSVALLEFTSCDARVSPLSAAWVLSLLPLARAFHAPRTATLPGVLVILEGACTVLSVQNVSMQYALLLADYARSLEDGTMRRRFLVSRGGENSDAALRAWRAEKLWAHWAAACYAVGSLARWIVCVRRLPDHP